MTPPAARHGLGDPRIPWIVLLEVSLGGASPTVPALASALAELAADAGWPPPAAGVASAGSPRELLAALATDSADVLRVGRHDHGVVLAARHDALDGLAMLTALSRLLGEDVHSSARGVDPARRGAPTSTALVSRALEVGLRPQAVVAASVRRPGVGDAFAVTTIDATPRTADLVHAGARAIVAWNRGHDVRARPVTVAVGVSTTGGASYELADRSGLLRLRGVDDLSPDEVRDHLARAPLQPGGAAPRRPRSAALTAGVLRLAAPRLGSTLLVSHLGALEAPAHLTDPAFYPVTGGGSGLSLGAATLRGRTTLTLRARASRHDDAGLQELLALVVAALG